MKKLLVALFSLFTLVHVAQAAHKPVAEGQRVLRNVFIERVTDPAAGPIVRQFGLPNSQLKRSLDVRVVDVETSRGVVGVPVRFRNIVRPEKAEMAKFSDAVVITDANGMAHVHVWLGDKPGNYVVSARIEPSAGENVPLIAASEDIALFELGARSQSWVLFLVMELIGGLALFMFGISQLSVGMRATAGQKLRRAMEVMTHNRFLAMGMGVFITVIFQSSCATTVMLVSFVQAGLLRAVQSLAIILGADIGTTMTVQLLTFKITDYSLIALALGFFLMSFARSAWRRHLGQTVLGLGLLFFGMSMMQHSTEPLRSYEPFVNALMQLRGVVPAVLAGAIFTALIRSSAAFIGIVIVFASQGLVNLETGIALCLGANLGTCVTAAIASLNASIEAKRVALAHALFKVIGISLLIGWIPFFSRIVLGFTGAGSSVERQIANAHTLFNVGIAFSFLPFLAPFHKLIVWILPDPVQPVGAFTLDRNLLFTPSLALSAAKREILNMGREAQKMLQTSLTGLFQGSSQVDSAAVAEMERSLDQRYEVLRSFLSSLMEHRLPEREAKEVLLSLRTLHDIEQIADIVEDRIVPRVEILRDNGIMLSEEGRTQLKDYHVKVLKQISRSLDLFDTLDAAKASHISERFERYCMIAYALKDQHFRRLQAHVVESEQTTNVHLNLVSALLDISNLATNIARHMKEQERAKPSSAASSLAADRVLTELRGVQPMTDPTSLTMERAESVLEGDVVWAEQGPVTGS